ncbi:hypothetical protein A2331_03385 [Candidatus Falkowbacteria bacterium RIFOXYB2_FULL_34_18]|uniref:Elp3/MiaA/NifB-like radical SAM core domain-containing protein n=1 Tax=Candidatus Falkowbacteria bacterium RIFOXYD2_FULL_34_120 TaxID=1798007 RepID=A0A1F5TNU5_9BACT|nr:MAG: hypothetical protein A2331_03385 [Candidatus Falkowbacteria bacterium RIFOXYB2_FULL_34_18]OGF28937.1 MAG: hypothetical protein A2500_01675 [Candidatus Falkowbacteria bacterium RIFOXYC12_FULL_34_55]OGF35864.1 MAG: hypothetical protein A2466_03705 [Candidatus Falkowbacteria bacterium RIFOXYC2_FULL_34_220]OGF38471.1 MAG: hypothetical protein A2515_07075 [Candidatus Falkowbacteria bacterium RIFOXYD12_FULL_34_57]OGF40537.1 MAG: hypothetical protein A2531_04490 [Candidatus Falkowbacteria bact
MKIKEIQAKSIITKSNLPASDFVINPYTGCSHACIYCYARFMMRFTGHDEEWGEFVDVKINAPELIPKLGDKYKSKSITIGSVTDPYQKCEEEYKITRNILEKLSLFDSSFDIITKSDLVARDIDLLKKFRDLTVAFSIGQADDRIRERLEPGAPSIENRIKVLKILYDNNIRTAVFISPIFPMLSDWKKIIELTKQYADEYWFENLNIYPSVRENIYKFLKNNYPELIDKYREIYKDEKIYWDGVENEIKDFCKKGQVNYKIYFHHKDIKKK